MKANKKKTISSFFSIFFSVALFLLLFFGLQQLVSPKYRTSLEEGRLIGEYYQDSQQNQVLILGDCEVYENFSPITLWEDYGITSYIRGGPQQLIWQSYYLLEEMLRYEQPNVVVFNVLAMQYSTPQSEAYNRLNIDGMKWSSSKWETVQNSMTSKESALSYLFPMFRYHERIISLEKEDFTHFFSTDTISHNGYLMQTGVKAVGKIPDGIPLADSTFDDICYEYLDNITELCKRNEINLVLVKAPSIYPHWYEDWDRQMVEYAKENQIHYYNFLDLVEEIGINYSEDTYDGGLHLNVYGAEKLSHYFGAILQEEFHLENQNTASSPLVTLWEEKVARYEAEKEAKSSQK